jgi:hypothetical protein
MIFVVFEKRKSSRLGGRIVIKGNLTQKLFKVSLKFQNKQPSILNCRVRRTLGRESCIFHVTIRILRNLGSIKGDFFGLEDRVLFSNLSLDVVVMSFCCGESGKRPCKRDKTLNCSPVRQEQPAVSINLPRVKETVRRLEST